MVSVLGFSFSGSGQNAALAFVTAQALGRARGRRALGAGDRRARLRRPVGRPRRLHLRPQPAGRSASSAPRPASRSACRTAAATATPRCSRRATSCSAMAAQSKVLAGVRPDGLEDAPQLQIDIDRDRASALGVGFDAHQRRRCRRRSARPTSTTSRTPAGCSASSCRPMRRDRMQPDDLLRLNVAQQPGPAGAAVGAWRRRAGSPARCRRSATTATRRCASPATPRPATATGDAMLEMERARARSCRPASPSNGPASRARSASPARPRRS